MPKRILCISFFVLLLSSIYGQGGLNSPFSRFGIGNINDQGGMHIRHMGGLGSSFVDPQQLNFINPASLSHLKFTAFDVGLEMQRSNLDDFQNTSVQWSGNLSYLSLAFPLRNPLNEVFSNEDYKFNWGMGFNLAPISTISYDISRVDSLPSIGAFERNFRGSGGFWKATWGNAIKYEDLSFGVNIGYVFGRDNFARNIDFIDEVTAYDNSFSREYSAKGFYWDAGLMYQLVLNKSDVEDQNTITEPRVLSIGLTGKSNAALNITSDISEVNFLVASAFNVLSDTLNFASDVKGKGTLPGELGFGMTYFHENQFAIGFDFKRTFWSNYRNDANPEELNNTTRIALGGYYRPNYKSINSFWERITYRAGLYIEEDPRAIDGQSIDNMGLTLGFGLPFSWQRKFSQLNLGINIGQRTLDNILKENFIKINLGFTFNDNEWFYKRKYN